MFHICAFPRPKIALQVFPSLQQTSAQTLLRDRPALTPRGRLCHRVLQGATALVFMYLQVSAHLRLRRTRSAGINRSVRQTVSQNNWSVSRTDRRMVYSGEFISVSQHNQQFITAHWSSPATKSSRISDKWWRSNDRFLQAWCFSLWGLEERSWNESSRISRLQMISWNRTLCRSQTPRSSSLSSARVFRRPTSAVFLLKCWKNVSF